MASPRSMLTALVVAVVLSSTGCASAGGPVVREPDPSGATGSPAATAEPTEGPVPERMLVEAEQLVLVADDDTEIESLPFTTDPLLARERLTAWFGAPPTTTEVAPTHYCADPSDPIVTDAWGDDVSIVHTGQSWAQYGVRFAAYIDAAAVGDIAIEAFDGSVVGDMPDALLSALPLRPGAFATVEDGLTRIYFDVPNPDYSAYAYAFDGEALSQIIAPYAREESC